MMKHRLFVLTDITSLEAGVKEPDDGQSMIRLVLYSNVIDIEGLVASSNLGHGQAVRPDLIHRVLDAYEVDLPRLRGHDDGFPDVELLRGMVHAGQPTADKSIPMEKSVGEGKDTAASEAVIKAVDEDDARPLWVAVWGGTADLAQALWKVRETRTAEEVNRFVAKIRVHAINDQDRTGPWIRQEFPGLFYILRTFGNRGMYRGGDTSFSSAEWVEEHVKGHGSLGELYPVYSGGDIWSRRLGQVTGLKEGDTPSYLNLISGDPMRGWGGTLIQTGPNLYEDELAPDADENDPDPRMAGVYRHRPFFQTSFALRMDWCKGK